MGDIERKTFLKVYVNDCVEKGRILLPKEGVQKIGLLKEEPVWVRLNKEPNIQYTRLVSKEDRKVGPQGCLVSPGDLSSLGLNQDHLEKDTPVGEMEILSAKPYYPSLWSISWQLPPEKPFAGEETPRVSDVPVMTERCVICLDVSSSMYGEKIAFAKMAVFTFFDKKNERNFRDEVGMVTFGDDSPAAVSTRFLPSPDFSSPDRIALVESLFAYNGTPLSEGLSEALNHIPGGSAPYRRILLITDGWGDNVDHLVRKAEEVNVVIDCVGIGDDCNRQMLFNLALQTGGRYREVRCYEDLIQEIEELAVVPSSVQPIPVQPSTGKDIIIAPSTGNLHGSSVSEDDLKEICTRIHELVNRQRQENGLEALTYDDSLAGVAVGHSEDMAGRGFFAHNNLEGKGLKERCTDKGIQRDKTGENIFCCQGMADPARSAVSGWMTSPGHRKNILERDFSHQGLGISRAVDGTYFVTQVFASGVK
jgi:uncharacterized protein YkwD